MVLDAPSLGNDVIFFFFCRGSHDSTYTGHLCAYHTLTKKTECWAYVGPIAVDEVQAKLLLMPFANV